MAVAELLAAAAAETDQLSLEPAGTPAPPPRDVVVVHGPAADLVAAVMAGWCVRTGAALMVEPDPARWPLALVWARPTIVAGNAADLDRLAERLQRLEREPRRLRRRLGPLGRARAIVRIGEPEAASAGWWRRLDLPEVIFERRGAAR